MNSRDLVPEFREAMGERNQPVNQTHPLAVRLAYYRGAWTAYARYG